MTLTADGSLETQQGESIPSKDVGGGKEVPFTFLGLFKSGALKGVSTDDPLPMEGNVVVDSTQFATLAALLGEIVTAVGDLDSTIGGPVDAADVTVDDTLATAITAAPGGAFTNLAELVDRLNDWIAALSTGGAGVGATLESPAGPYNIAYDATEVSTPVLLLNCPTATPGDTLTITMPDSATRSVMRLGVLGNGGANPGPTVAFGGPTVNIQNSYNLPDDAPIKSFTLYPINGGDWAAERMLTGTDSVDQPIEDSSFASGNVALFGDNATDVVPIELTGDITGWDLPTYLSPRPGVVTHVYTQDGVGTRIIDSDNLGTATILWVGGSAPTLSTAAGDTDVIRFTELVDGTWLGELVETGLTL